MRAARAVAALLVLPLGGCILAVDHGGRKGLEKRLGKLERRIEELERRPPPAISIQGATMEIEGLPWAGDAGEWVEEGRNRRVYRMVEEPAPEPAPEKPARGE